ncbi:MAG: hypothetical protein M5R41_01570 [Bacteroidia bacterium]|nr:hypothetical protein [Bacteroidia bacterium]
MSFAKQFLSRVRPAEFARKRKRLDPGVHDIPESQDQNIAKPKLATLGHKIDKLTPEQVASMNDFSAWSEKARILLLQKAGRRLLCPVFSCEEL